MTDQTENIAIIKRALKLVSDYYPNESAGQDIYVTAMNSVAAVEAELARLRENSLPLELLPDGIIMHMEVLKSITVASAEKGNQDYSMAGARTPRQAFMAALEKIGVKS